MRTRVKICGITRPEDGVRAAALGADAVGLVFLTVGQAREIAAALPPFVTRVRENGDRFIYLLTRIWANNKTPDFSYTPTVPTTSRYRPWAA